jgi:lactate dehydrogenase-like 2-hydroxyacid dehydrogenase
MRKIAILDDYIGVALDYGDWTVLPDDAEITVYREAIPPERLVDVLADYEIVVITQQRARFPRAVLEGLPNLKLIVCNGRTSNVVDHEARVERGILLCGTAETGQAAAVRPLGYQAPRGLPTPSEMAWALIFAVANSTREFRAVIDQRRRLLARGCIANKKTSGSCVFGKRKTNPTLRTRDQRAMSPVL